MTQRQMRAYRKMAETQIEEANREGRKRYGPKRQITLKQEMAYRLCHQDHFALSAEDAAKVMGITRQSLWELLHRVEATAPQLFPILEPKTAKIYRLLCHDNFSIREIAEQMGVGEHWVREALCKLYTGGRMYFHSKAARRLHYEPWMDHQAVRRW